MKYFLNRNGIGTLIDRKHVVFFDYLELEFENCRKESMLSLQSNGKTLIYPITNGICKLPASKLNGELNIFVLHDSQRWECDSLVAEKLPDGGTLCVPNEMNISKKISELVFYTESLEKRIKNAESDIALLNKKIERMMEGYDII